jgi:A/G-specific adenine glycosylase
MSQQTQLSRVAPRFERFIRRWPTEHDLAKATIHEVLNEWSGLGYNSRAVRLRNSAATVSEHGWPTNAAGLTSLPGVGPYTANAIASIAFGEQVPAVDTNMRRVLSRWVGRPLSGRELVEVAASLVPEAAGDWNQAIMDLGAALCRPRRPLCAACPVASGCVDSTIYQPSERQTAFEGSVRQLRGAVVRAHLAGADLMAAGDDLGRSAEETASVISMLKAEGLLQPATTRD